MKSRLIVLMTVAVAMLNLHCSAPWQPPTMSVVHPKDTLALLASDELQGRGVGTEGLDLAAKHISDCFRSLGLVPPPGMAGYSQEFQMTYQTRIDARTFMQVGEDRLGAGSEFTVTGQSAEGAFSGPIVFAGYGISSPEQHYDDYANLDVKGKIVLVLRFEPHDENGKSRFTHDVWSDLAAIVGKAKTAADKGAVAMLMVQPPMYHGADSLMPYGRSMDDRIAPIPVMQISARTADQILAKGSVKDLKSLQRAIDETGKPASAELNSVQANGEVQIYREKKTVKNILAVIPGTGPTAREYIVVGAHYDHLGMRKGLIGATLPSTQPTIHAPDVYHGADDNASGTTAMLELADILARQGPHKRSILFAAFTAEESGLIGSRYFVDHPPVPLKDIVAMVNLDMVGRVRDDKIFISGQGTAEAFKSILTNAGAHSPLKVSGMSDGGIGPSDHTSFAIKKIPVLFFFSGLHQDYHRPTDEFEKINFSGIDMVVGFVGDVVRAMTEMPRQKYIDVSDAKSPHMYGGGPGTRVTLGVMPNYGTETTDGVLIDGTIPGSPAAKAGIQTGDILIGIGAKRIQSIYDLMDVLQSGKPGDKVTIKVIRLSKVVELSATLEEKK